MNELDFRWVVNGFRRQKMFSKALEGSSLSLSSILAFNVVFWRVVVAASETRRTNQLCSVLRVLLEDL